MAEGYIIAIDLGTAFSGFAFSISCRDDDIHVKRWGSKHNQDTPKTPTCILFHPDQSFRSFGYDARSEYMGMKSSEAKHCFYFENFKMALYGKRRVRESLMITAVNKRQMKALTVFSEALRFLKDDALETITKNSFNCQFLASDFTWVLTVPAIWDDSAKQFMREAATQAGIVSRDGGEEKLVIALEPEAASIWCKNLPPQGFLTENHNRISLQKTPGTKYVVVDCGGGTIDITVHEVLQNEKLKELQKASGNDMGGETVDRKFREFLREIFRDGVWDKYESEFPNEVQRLMNDFTFQKQSDREANFNCSMNLGITASKNKPIEMFFDNVQGVSYSEGSFQISQQKMRSFFEESLWRITDSLQKVLHTEPNVDYLLLVGGYALSKVLRDHVELQFGSQYKVLCPHLPQEAVMKGAVKFGRDPAAVQSRKSPFTYGYNLAKKFDASKHKVEKKFLASEGEYCEDLFERMIKIDDEVGWNEVRKYTSIPVYIDQKSMRFKFIRTERDNLMYVDDEGAEQVGEFQVEMPDTTGGLNRTVQLEVRFGYTEITATATDLTSNSKGSVKFNFI